SYLEIVAREQNKFGIFALSTYRGHARQSSLFHQSSASSSAALPNCSKLSAAITMMARHDLKVNA
ncbi:MAG: hypothetical protein AAGJ80_20195, partial [Cyanobacteria bacterium J06553_1]